MKILLRFVKECQPGSFLSIRAIATKYAEGSSMASWPSV
jgi:hypothetical protein